MKNSFKATDLAYMALCVALLAICSWISIPMVVPFTLQTFAVFCVLGILGGRRGTLAILVFLLLGAIGLPVFSGFTGGIGKLLGTTGGYLLGFIFIGLIYWLAEKFFPKTTFVEAAAMVIGLIVCYAFGTAWFICLYTRNTGAITIGAALSWCVLPFVIPDLVKLALALFISKRVRRVLR